MSSENVFEICGLQTQAQPRWSPIETGEKPIIDQWAVITLRVPKDFDWKANGPAVLKKLQQAAELIGRAG